MNVEYKINQLENRIKNLESENVKLKAIISNHANNINSNAQIIKNLRNFINSEISKLQALIRRGRWYE